MSIQSSSEFFSTEHFQDKLPLSSCSPRPAAFSTNSVSYPGFRAAYTTSVNCVVRGCGTAATSPPWSVQENTRTLRAAPMEACPPLSRPPPHRHPHPHLHQSPFPRLWWRARKDPKPGIFSPSVNTPEQDLSRILCLRSPLTSQFTVTASCVLG